MREALNSGDDLRKDDNIDARVDYIGSSSVDGTIFEETFDGSRRSHLSGCSSFEDINEGQTRKIYLNQIRPPSTASKQFLSNSICTAKYNVLTFIPKFLYEQFRRYSNIFFLIIAMLQQIPNVSPTGRYVTLIPLLIILTVTAIKELIEDIKRHHADDKDNQRLVKVLTLSGEWVKREWRNVKVGDIVLVFDENPFPADLILLASSEPLGMCYIETSNLDGETNLKIRSAVQMTIHLSDRSKLCNFRGIIEYEEPNNNLYEFNGRIYEDQTDGSKMTSLTPSALLLRGSKLMNTNWVIGAVVYTGHQTKLLMNSTEAPLKRSKLDIVTNSQIIFLFTILVLIAMLSAAANSILSTTEQIHDYLDVLSSNNFVYNCLTFFILYNNLIPISLQVTLEMVKFIQSYYINWDTDMYHAETKTPAMARTSNLNEELGQIKYVLTDKTGTLTRNVMRFRQCSVGGKKYVQNEDEDQIDGQIACLDDDVLRDFLVLMSVCHTVIPEIDEVDGSIFYNASSPDEKALVNGAAKFGYKFVARTADSVVIETGLQGKRETYDILDVIEFTSSRKCMSVVVRTPSGLIKVMTKGADTAIMDRVNCPEAQLHAQTMIHMEEFAKMGFRTLCLAVADVSSEFYLAWSKEFRLACSSLLHRETNMAEVASKIERNLRLIGATAIEDKLQEGVPETIASLLQANIHVWMLTGDKQETAINIGHSCRLLLPGMHLVLINCDSMDDTRRIILEQLSFLRENDNKRIEEGEEIAVVVSGKGLEFALSDALRKDFMELCSSCRSVICCRVSPKQKADVVALVRDFTNDTCLAIGDGANDVAMIQKAHVGVGISGGNEGLQAANNSDFSIGQFRFLAKLLFVHGAWNHIRISKVILYSFYKNICLYVIELWFAIYSYWSGQVLFERWTIGMYNLLFTSAAPVAIGLLDRSCFAETRLRNPQLYCSVQNSEHFNHRVFWTWVLNSMVHSIIIYWLTLTAYTSGVLWPEGYSSDYLVMGNMVYTLVVVTVCLKAGLEMDSWNFLSHISIWGSITLWFTFLFVYSFFWAVGIPVAANMTGIGPMLYASPVYWLGFVLIPFCAIFIDVSVKALSCTMYPSPTDLMRKTEVANRNSNMYRKSKYSSLISNVRQAFHLKPSSISEAPSGDSRRRWNDAEVEMASGFAFSQEEEGAVSQTEYIRRYGDTTRRFRRHV